MPLIFGAAVSSAALIRLVCPRCGEVQARARQPAGARYACRACRHTFAPPAPGALYEPRGRRR
ncbi:MAG TPA: hypothetical protein VFS43_17350 [Polyangiaceae bacterium]|nr:hypothetical protein [Polyangiaceae bacterium]